MNGKFVLVILMEKKVRLQVNKKKKKRATTLGNCLFILDHKSIKVVCTNWVNSSLYK